MSTSLWREIVVAPRAGSYEERTCVRCFEGNVYDMERGAWVACERCSGSGRVVVYLYPKLKRRSR
jgi:PHP family Zn ribbon phosphoesterase